MTVMIEVPAALVHVLRARAELRGLAPEAYVVQVLEREFGNRSTVAPQTESGRKVLEWVNSLPDAPVVSDEAISRESIYEDRG